MSERKSKAPAGGMKSRQALERMLEKRNQHPESLAEIDREIWQTFGQTRAIFVLDMCGFSRLTVRYGITHFLAMIQRLHSIVLPIVTRGHGRVVKTEADNVFGVFESVEDALSAARDVQDALATANAFLPDDWDLHASIGLGWGEVLMLSDDDDFYGNELNLASKLGEDIAEPGETLLTEAAHARLIDEVPKATLSFDMREIIVSKMALKAYALA